MGVPKKHKTRSGRNQRRAHDFLKPRTQAKCPNCGQAVRPHEICSNCGQYKGRQAKTV
jgi:large subunit ribosomal protein L32